MCNFAIRNNKETWHYEHNLCKEAPACEKERDNPGILWNKEVVREDVAVAAEADFHRLRREGGVGDSG